jgi:hypothetical protein
MMSFICRIILPFMAAITATAQLGGTEPSLITVSRGPVASKFEPGHVASTLHSSTVITLQDQAYHIDGAT